MTACPNCKNMNTDVKDSRPKLIIGRRITQRRRACRDCNNRFTTYEVDARFSQYFKELESRDYTRALSTLKKIKKIIEEV